MTSANKCNKPDCIHYCHSSPECELCSFFGKTHTDAKTNDEFIGYKEIERPTYVLAKIKKKSRKRR